MAGPTPVSALIHAATMVCAGVYLVARLFMVFDHANPSALAFVGAIGAITMLIAATMALVQDDIKRVLAYSTVSQLAYMMAALSLGPAGYTPGLFHLFTHAFFKSCLFFGAGSVIHAVRTNDMGEMGGLRKRMPVTFWTFLIATLALCGVPPLAGFFSKDSIIAAAYDTHHYAIWGVALVTAFLTALYMIRAVMLTFTGTYRGAAHPHESPGVMTAPMILLAILSASVGFLGGTVWKGGFATWVAIPGLPDEQFQLGAALISVVVATAGIALGYVIYRQYRRPEPMRSLGPLYTLFQRKYYMDDLYTEGVRKPIQYPIALGTAAFDRTVIDGGVNGVGTGTRRLGGVLKFVQSGNVQRYAVFLFAGVAILAFVITRL
jgi:NADH-quinone oxidoreductase subunit L